MHKVVISYTFDDRHILQNIVIEQDETQLSKINQYDFLEAIANITHKAIDNNKAQQSVESVLKELNIPKNEDT